MTRFNYATESRGSLKSWSVAGVIQPPMLIYQTLRFTADLLGYRRLVPPAARLKCGVV